MSTEEAKEMRSILAFVETLPLSIREVARLEGAGAALREWHRRGQAFIADLQAQREGLRSEVDTIRRSTQLECIKAVCNQCDHDAQKEWLGGQEGGSDVMLHPHPDGGSGHVACPASLIYADMLRQDEP